MTPCQPMVGKQNRKGYAKISIDGENFYAHRVAFALGHGKDPGTLLVRHRCDNKNCVNHEHLELGTHVQNMNDKSRTAVAKGSNNPSAKLTDADVLWARSALAVGATCKAVALALGVSDVTVGLIKRRKTWRHL